MRTKKKKKKQATIALRVVCAFDVIYYSVLFFSFALLPFLVASIINTIYIYLFFVRLLSVSARTYVA